MTGTNRAQCVVVHNPVSGDAEHADTVRDRAAIRGYEVTETAEAGDAIAMAREAAADGASVVVAAGGDGTINEVVRGIDRADALDRVTLGVIPTGTGNNFAGNIGIPSVEDGFSVLENGERRRIDLGRAGDRPFVNSCIGGLTAEASAETSADMKTRLGTLAYAITTLRTARDFDGLRLTIDLGEDDGRTGTWEGEAICVLVGNGRRFSPGEDSQANMEDGRFEVTIIEEMPATDMMEAALVERLTGGDVERVTNLRTAALEIDADAPEPISFSLDGEMIDSRALSLATEASALGVLVGPGYDPDPDR
jgi:YegS/Rv2252/BmrU family lipid kinase